MATQLFTAVPTSCVGCDSSPTIQTPSTRFWVAIDGFWIGEWIYCSEISITAPPLISTIHRSQHPLRIFQPAVSSPAIPWQRLLTVEIIQLHALRTSLHRLPYRTERTLSPQLSSLKLLVTDLVETLVSNSTFILARRFLAVGTCLPSRFSIVTAIHATIHTPGYSKLLSGFPFIGHGNPDLSCFRKNIWMSNISQNIYNEYLRSIWIVRCNSKMYY
jgi:hypothetical protein